MNNDVQYFYALDEVLDYNSPFPKYEFIDFIHTIYFFEVVKLEKNEWKIINVLYLKDKELNLIIKNGSIIKFFNGMIDHEIKSKTGEIYESIFPSIIVNKNDVKFYSEFIENSINNYMNKLNDSSNDTRHKYNIDYKLDENNNIIISNIRLI